MPEGPIHITRLDRGSSILGTATQRNAVSSRRVVFDEARLEQLGLRTPDRRDPR
jgi:hypothetical protein